MNNSVRAGYEELGIEGYYKNTVKIIVTLILV